MCISRVYRRHLLAVPLGAVLTAMVLTSSGLASAESAPVPKLRLVSVKLVQSGSKETVTGQLGPSRMLPLGFEVGGRLVLSKVKKGEVVKAGQLLGSLDTEIIDAQIIQAEAGVMAAESAAALASDVAGRNEKLKAEGSVSDLQSKQTSMQAKGAQAQLKHAQAALAQARAGHRRHSLRAPFGGTVIEAPDQTGGMVGPGMPIYVIMQLDPLVLKATIPENIRAMVHPGLIVHVEATGSRAERSDASVQLVLPSADPQTRRIPIEIAVPNADGKFVANTLAKVTLPMGGLKDAVIIPATALGTTGGDHVFVVATDGTLQRIPVTVTERAGAIVTVIPTSPVNQVVDYPSAALVEGTKVTQR
jgi:RND family efflux transporter MFP subunit